MAQFRVRSGAVQGAVRLSTGCGVATLKGAAFLEDAAWLSYRVRHGSVRVQRDSVQFAA